MSVRILTGADVRRLLPMERCIDAMEQVLVALARGQAIQPLRTMLRLPRDRGVFGVMPAQTDQPDVFGVKVITVYPSNEGTPYDSHQGAVLLFEPAHGTLAAIMDATALTGIRTAAVSGLATRWLSNPAAGDLALLGTGVQARTHLEAMHCVRPIRRVRVWSRSPANRASFRAWARSRFDVDVELAESPRQAVEGADLICTVTSSPTPVLEGGWLSDGTHINAVGASLPERRELDSDAVARCRLYADRVESARSEAGDYLVPLAEGRIGEDHLLGEIGQVAAGILTGRRNDAEITLFKSLGLAVEDMASAHAVLEAAATEGAGAVIDLGGLRDDDAR